MAVAQNSLLFLLRNTLPDYLIDTVFEQEGLFLIIGMDLRKEILSILFFPLLWDFSGAEEIGNVSIPGSFFQLHQGFFRKFIIDGWAMSVMGYR